MDLVCVALFLQDDVKSEAGYVLHPSDYGIFRSAHRLQGGENLRGDSLERIEERDPLPAGEDSAAVVSGTDVGGARF
jgi:hypothetical protein